jgi:hypothetical protein
MKKVSKIGKPVTAKGTPFNDRLVLETYLDVINIMLRKGSTPTTAIRRLNVLSKRANNK